MCGAMEAHLRLCEIDPEFRVRRGKIHAETELMVRRGLAMRRVEKKVLTISVVVHVVYRTPGENIEKNTSNTVSKTLCRRQCPSAPLGFSNHDAS